MKNQIRSLLLAILTTVIFNSCGGGQQEQVVKINTPEEVKEEQKQNADIADASFIDGMTGKVFYNYIKVKMALTNSDLSAAQSSASNLAEAFTEERTELKALAEQMSEADNLETQREIFAEFTVKVEPLITDGLSGGTIYKKYCPMAFDNKGAFWLADTKEIRNPYFGEKMLNCGSVKETITKK